jgi:hypothetical protein
MISDFQGSPEFGKALPPIDESAYTPGGVELKNELENPMGRAVQMICKSFHVPVDAAPVEKFLGSLVVSYAVTEDELPTTVSAILVFLSSKPKWHGWVDWQSILLTYSKLRNIGYSDRRAIEIAIPGFIIRQFS